MKVSIILPMYGRWNLTMARLGEFRTHLPKHCEIIVVDDCSPEDQKDRIRNGMAFWQKGGVASHKIRYLENEENLGFGGSMNRGASIAENEILVFHSNDVIVSGDFITPLIKLFDSEDPILVGHRLIWWEAGWNQFNLGKPKVIPYLEGYFISCTQSVFDEIGGWDTRYGKYDYEDVDLSMAAQVLGYNLIEFPSPYLSHIGGATINHSENRMNHTRQNREVFIKKWKDILLEQ